jgi:hypothetical protein
MRAVAGSTSGVRDAIGARVRVTVGGRTQVREVRAGSSYLSQIDLRQHFGLGDATLPIGSKSPGRRSASRSSPG